jgi:hypothetical protein
MITSTKNGTPSSQPRTYLPMIFSPEAFGPPAKRACAPYGYASELQMTCHRILPIADGSEAVESRNVPVT